MIDRHQALFDATAEAVQRGPGHTPAALRQQVAAGTPPAELTGLVAKIADDPYKVTDADLDTLRDRYSEDALFEIVVAAAHGAAATRLQAALAALEAA